MKYAIVALLCLLKLSAHAQEDFIIQLGDKTYHVSLDSTYQAFVGGEKLKLTLKQKDTLTFRDPLFSFSYPRGVQYAKAKIDNSVDQYTLLTGEGAGFLIQRFFTMNPSLITDLMLQEVTKESIGYGYQEKREKYTRKLKSGQSVTVTRAVLTYKDEVAVYEVVAIGGKDEGILVVTIDPSSGKAVKAQELIKLMWQTLTYKQ